jgi:hypothetical protein
MQLLILLIEKSRVLRITAAACLLVFTFAGSSFAQYKGAPVKKDRLIKALRSKQLQTGDIVAVIYSNGVDFKLTNEVKNSLIAAGARPEVIRAVAGNFRQTSADRVLYAKKDAGEDGQAGGEYNALLEKALHSYEEEKNSASAARYLKSAISLRPGEAKAYQMLGFVNLYGLNDLENTRKYMRESMNKGGSAVFRVYHDDSGNFTGRCSGSLFLSADKIRFESDDNIHTFETSLVNVEKIHSDTESSKLWNKHPVFNVYLKFGKEKAKFRFAPMSGKTEESNMAAFFITELQNSNPDGRTINFGSAVLNIKSTF